MMAVISRSEDLGPVLEKYRQLSRPDMMAQQLILRGGIDCMEFLLEHPGNEPAEILDDLRHQLMELHEVANERGIQLVSYS